MRDEAKDGLGTKERILEESARLFAEKGYSSTGIDEIAKSVGITKSVIYYHFKNKKDILDTLIQNLFDELIRRKKEAAHQFIHDKGMQARDIFTAMDIFATEMNRRIVKIVLMESIKTTGDIPLFKFWDLNFSVLQGLYEEHSIETLTKDRLPGLMLETFFMYFLPVIGFLVFQDRWSEHYDISSADSREIMLNALEEHYEKVARPKMWDV